ncbi:MAG: MBL fold metallo-hydrolase [Candidatus Rokuibacteriota bacterium]|nr:MAG: MBL fold metallo-hydrolase [Candidatus Rokubacteria bacterium]
MDDMTRRGFLREAAGGAAAALLLGRGQAAAQGTTARTRLILLGTGGGPRILAPGRAKPANVLVVNGAAYVVDCGSGVAHQFVKAGVPLTTLRAVFITHHHSDHNLDYGNLIYSAWAAGLRTAVDTYGPPPLRAITDAYWQLNRFDIETRIADEGRPDLRRLVAAHEFDQPGLVMQTGDVKVTAARVFHPPIDQSYAYRFDAADRSIVISGDTGYSPDLITLATGADLLVHEVMHLGGVESLLKRVPNAATLRVNLLRHHTSTEDVGRVAAAAGVKTLVLTHFVPPDDASLSDEMWLEGVRKHYGGRIVMGQDLLEL